MPPPEFHGSPPRMLARKSALLFSYRAAKGSLTLSGTELPLRRVECSDQPANSADAELG